MDVRRTDRTSPLRRLLGVIVLGPAVALVLLGCAAVGASGSAAATRAASLDGMSLTLLVAGPDGMRGRTDLAGTDGMLFDLGREVDPGAVGFVMDGVALPLDIAWFDADGALIGTASMTPCAAEPCPRTVAPGPFRWAIETPVGRFADLAPGTRLTFPDG